MRAISEDDNPLRSVVDVLHYGIIIFQTTIECLLAQCLRRDRRSAFPVLHCNLISKMSASEVMYYVMYRNHVRAGPTLALPRSAPQQKACISCSASS